MTIGPTNNGGAGAVTLSNPANDWTGDTVVVSQGGNGGLVIGANEVIPHGVGKGSFILNHQMSFAGNADETVNNLSGGSTASEITTSGGINTLTVLSLVNSTYAGRIRGNNSSSGQGNRKIELFKEGNATLTLTNSNNNYVGQTQINAGTLLVNGSLSMIGETGDANPAAVALPVTVNANGTLGGTGTINRPVTLAGGTLSPGASAGQITIGNNLSGNGSYLWEMGTLHDQSSGTAGTNWDLVQLTDGTATLGGMLVDLDFSLLGANGPSSANPFWNTDHQWKILDLINTASLGSTFSGINPSDILTPRGSFSLSLGSGPNANDAFLNFTAATAGAVPEPASIAVWSLLGLALASYGVARRRRAAR